MDGKLTNKKLEPVNIADVVSASIPKSIPEQDPSNPKTQYFAVSKAIIALLPVSKYLSNDIHSILKSLCEEGFNCLLKMTQDNEILEDIKASLAATKDSDKLEYLVAAIQDLEVLYQRIDFPELFD